MLTNPNPEIVSKRFHRFGEILSNIEKQKDNNSLSPLLFRC